MTLAISLMAYEFKDPNSLGALVQLGEKKWAHCPDELVEATVGKAKAINGAGRGYNEKRIAEAANKAEQYEYMKTAQKVDKQMNDEIEALYNKYMNIASKIAEDMCEIRDSFHSFGSSYKSKLSPEEVYQHLEEYFK